MKAFFLIATCSLALLAFGCSSGPSPDLQVYERGLSPIDSALYDQHTTLMADAVKDGIRTAADQMVVTQEIIAAKALHAKALTTQPTQ